MVVEMLAGSPRLPRFACDDSAAGQAGFRAYKCYDTVYCSWRRWRGW
jgi:hypothetical protein